MLQYLANNPKNNFDLNVMQKVVRMTYENCKLFGVEDYSLEKLCAWDCFDLLSFADTFVERYGVKKQNLVKGHPNPLAETRYNFSCFIKVLIQL